MQFWSGGALGIDQMAAEIVILARNDEKYLGEDDIKVELCFALPCYGFESKWPKTSRERFDALLQSANIVTYAHEGPYPGSYCLQDRNQILVDVLYDKKNREYLGGLYSVYDGSTGGTRNCMLYAWKQGVPILRLNPKTREESRYRNEKKALALTGQS